MFHRYFCESFTTNISVNLCSGSGFLQDRDMLRFAQQLPPTNVVALATSLIFILLYQGQVLTLDIAAHCCK